MEFQHTSVLLQECIDNLCIRPDGIYVDGTLGGGGHSYEIARRLSDKGRLIGIDRDDAAIAAAGERLMALPSSAVEISPRPPMKTLPESARGVTGIHGSLP